MSSQKLIHVYACNNSHCPFIGTEEDFRFNPSFRKSTSRILSQCPSCGMLGFHLYGYADSEHYKKFRLRIMKWEHKYFIWRNERERNVFKLRHKT